MGSQIWDAELLVRIIDARATQVLNISEEEEMVSMVIGVHYPPNCQNVTRL